MIVVPDDLSFWIASMTRRVSQLNYYRLEAGRFEDFVSNGLKSFAHEGVTKTRWSPSPDTIPT